MHNALERRTFLKNTGDWPHPSEDHKPDDALLFDLLSVWAPDETTRNRILVANPESLYGF
jgi:predicted TIM-barrel fold metal-dependent hydrolase